MCLHRVVIQHRDSPVRDTKPAGKACNDMRDLTQMKSSKMPEQHQNTFPQPPKQNDRNGSHEYEELCTKAHVYRKAAKSKDKITKELKGQSSAKSKDRIIKLKVQTGPAAKRRNT